MEGVRLLLRLCPRLNSHFRQALVLVLVLVLVKVIIIVVAIVIVTVPPFSSRALP